MVISAILAQFELFTSSNFRPFFVKLPLVISVSTEWCAYLGPKAKNGHIDSRMLSLQLQISLNVEPGDKKLIYVR